MGALLALLLLGAVASSEGSEYHECYVSECNEITESMYCEEHSCKDSNCDRKRAVNSDYCYGHKTENDTSNRMCSKDGCYYPVAGETNDFCIYHVPGTVSSSYKKETYESNSSIDELNNNTESDTGSSLSYYTKDNYYDDYDSYMEDWDDFCDDYNAWTYDDFDCGDGWEEW